MRGKPKGPRAPRWCLLPWCEGCNEARATRTLPEIGGVCESCFEVPQIVYDVVLERVRAANAKLRALLKEWEVDDGAEQERA